MQKWRLWRYILPLLFAGILPVAVSVSAHATAANPTSSNYQLTESQFGNGGGTSTQSCSGQYCSQVSIGNVTGGDSTSSGTSAKFGAVTNSDPELQVIVQTGVSDLGVLTTEKTATRTMVVKILNYLSSGYALQIMGSPPKYNGHYLATPNTPSQSVPGTEQFGLNLATNTNPTVGADPVQVPSSQTSFGNATSDYNSPNLFKYVDGDTVGRSTKSSGETDYTISMVVNISNATPAGNYTGDFSAVVVPVY